MSESYTDLDPEETREWLEAMDAVLEREGAERASFLLEKLNFKAVDAHVELPYSANTPYVNTIPPELEEKSPGDHALEWKLRSIMRWNAMAMVVKANRKPASPGGHIASYASSATLYEMGFNHFWRAPTENHPGDFIYFQGHSAPGVYARAFLEGRITEEQLDNFRSEVDGKGLSSYPHPWLMPNFWRFPTVSMGLGPIMAIYQARFLKYLQNRGLIPENDAKVWVFLGDGETDEPESQGAIGLAVREKLDNLVFVVNCNLQRLDGPVRGNGKIVQELEANFRGSGWNVIKLLWGSYWDPLFAKDHKGLLRKRMEEAVDGEYQAFKAFGGAYTREHFFGKYPELKDMVSSMSDEDIWRLNRGGHDPHKIYAAYTAAMKSKGQPTLILAKTVKGYGMGDAGEGQNITHQQKKMGEEAMKKFRDRFQIPITDDQIEETPYFKPADDSPEMKYLHERRKAMGGYLPQRRAKAEQSLKIPELSAFEVVLKDTGDRTMSTTMAVVRLMAIIGRDKEIGPRLVPIVPDEARTFGMEGMFRQLGIYAHQGQLYRPMDADQVMPYREDKKGQILQEGINEAGSFSSWIAASTAYSNYNVQMIPVYLFYSMFGFQRIGDLAWAAGDSQARGFLIGGTAGRTTLNGEGLQHQDGHSQLFAQFIPNCISYDPTFAYEVAVIFQDGMRRMFAEQENVFYYITTMNENYPHPGLPEGAEEGIIKGLYRLSQAEAKGPRVQLIGCGTILREAMAAVALLADDWGVAADVWSATSFNELHRDGNDAQRWNMLHPDESPRKSWVEQCFAGTEGPVIATSDYIKLFAEQIRPFIKDRPYHVLGCDGYGRSDSREALRHHFEVDRYFTTVAALYALAEVGQMERSKVGEAMKKYGIDPEKANPLYV